MSATPCLLCEPSPAVTPASRYRRPPVLPSSPSLLREPPPNAPSDSANQGSDASPGASAPTAPTGCEAPSPARLAPDFDGVWKHILETWLPCCLALFWPGIHAHIDWVVPPVFLDKELKRLDRIVKKGKRELDVLAELRLRTGARALLLLHMEIQGGRVGAAFPQRMFHYRVRLYEKYPDHAMLSCAILLDRKTGPKTRTFRRADLGDELIFRFPVMNLLQWRNHMAKLEALAPANPFAVVVMTQLACRATRPNEKRLAGKLELARSLTKWGYDEKARWALFRVIDSLLVLPEALEEQFTDSIEQSGDPIMMQQLTSVERVLARREKAAGLEEGRREGRLEGKQEGRLEGVAGVLLTLIQGKFGPVPDWAEVRIAQADVTALEQWALNVLNADQIEDVFGG